MTDTAGMPSGPDRPDPDGAPPEPKATYGPGAGSSPTGAGVVRRRRRWLRWTAIGAATVVLGTAGVGWAVYNKLDGNITTDTDAAAELARYEKERPTPLVHDAQNILLIGSDTRAGRANKKYGRDPGTQRSDTTILLHLAADRQSATAVSIPRDVMVDIPRCRRPDGSRTRAQFAQFNWAYEFGGTACTIRTIEKLTRIRIDHHIVIDFAGFKDMVEAVDGVEVCLKTPIRDKDAKVKLAAGRQTLNGEQALGYVRARKSIGNGSDTDRMDRQQQFLAALVNKVRSNDVLLNPAKLYPVLDAATSALTTDPGLASLRGLYELVRGMRNIPTERVQFLTVPRRSYVYDANRDELEEPEAEELFTRLRTDAPLQVSRKKPPQVVREDAEDSSDDGSDDESDEKPDDPSDTPSPAPTFRGNTAAGTACK
ncbi:LCP family protein [Streptomyces sp. NBC_01381]|uniref:LCP family protein n=1 Tax=Streptomyces sp. NBC_01381 TaxID=2903845 RepID=UPI002255182E|nr:LCP family protein [Streptomyces sp. NBC_01381]MCX4666798.1 LCP family protein [Streptomyces sp. NBC_01381]